MDELRRHNRELGKQLDALKGKGGAAEAKKRGELEVVQEQMRNLIAENKLLRSAAAQNAAKLQTISREQAQTRRGQLIPGQEAMRSTACVIS